MKPKRKQFVRNVTALVDADPTFVSIVSAGANGSPFNVVKQENPTMKIKKRTAATKAAAPVSGKDAVRKNANNRVAKGKEALSEVSPTNRAITKFFYSKEDFETEAEVREHLAKSDFEGAFEVAEDDDQFVVTATDIDAKRVSKSAVIETGDEGVKAEVSILKDEASEEADESDEDDAEESDETDDDTGEEGDDEDDATDEDDDAEADDDDGEEDATAQKAAESAPAPAKSKKAAFLADLAEEVEAESVEPVEETLKKFDFWGVYDSASSDFITLLKAGCEDGLAPGFDDVMWTFGHSIRNALQADEGAEDNLKKNADDFITVVVGMHNLFSNIVNADMAVIEKADKPRAETLTKWAKSFGKALVEKAEKPAAVKKEAQVQVQNSTGIDPKELASAIAEAVAPMAEQLATVVKTVDKLGNRRQISKGIDPADATTSEGSTKPAATQKKAADPKAVEAAKRLGKTVFAAR